MVGVKAVYETPLDIFFVTELVGGGMLEWVVWWCLMFPAVAAAADWLCAGWWRREIVVAMSLVFFLGGVGCDTLIAHYPMTDAMVVHTMARRAV